MNVTAIRISPRALFKASGALQSKSTSSRQVSPSIMFGLYDGLRVQHAVEFITDGAQRGVRDHTIGSRALLTKYKEGLESLGSNKGTPQSFQSAAAACVKNGDATYNYEDLLKAFKPAVDCLNNDLCHDSDVTEQVPAMSQVIEDDLHLLDRSRVHPSAHWAVDIVNSIIDCRRDIASITPSTPANNFEPQSSQILDLFGISSGHALVQVRNVQLQDLVALKLGNGSFDRTTQTFMNRRQDIIRLFGVSDDSNDLTGVLEGNVRAWKENSRSVEKMQDVENLLKVTGSSSFNGSELTTEGGAATEGLTRMMWSDDRSAVNTVVREIITASDDVWGKEMDTLPENWGPHLGEH